MKDYRLVSCKGVFTVHGTLDDAIARAEILDDRLQPAFGISIEDEHGDTVATVGWVAED